jgi:acetyl esterase/lipase
MQPNANSDPNLIRLWPGIAPHASGDADPLDVPTLTLFPPVRPRGGAIMVCPGGGYAHLAAHEGETIAKAFAARGIFAGVLKYRLGPRHAHPAMLLDAKRGLRTLRSRADSLGFRADRIAVIGFSAGGHLASTLATLHDGGDAASSDPIERVSSRPDRAILSYPVITLTGPHAHVGSRNNLLGPAKDDDKLAASLSSQNNVNLETPPTFLWSTSDDSAVPVENSLLFALALRSHKIDCELHSFDGFGAKRHGIGLNSENGRAAAGWFELAVDWLREAGW